MLNFGYTKKPKTISTRSTIESIFEGATSLFDSGWQQFGRENHSTHITYGSREAEMVQDSWINVGAALNQALQKYALQSLKSTNGKVNGRLKYHS